LSDKSESPQKPGDGHYFTLHMLNMHLGCIGGGNVVGATASANGSSSGPGHH
jgi:hypothetical protein